MTASVKLNKEVIPGVGFWIGKVVIGKEESYMVVSLPGRICAGCSLALVVALSASGSVLLANAGSLRSHLHVVVVGIAIAGLIFLVRGQWKSVRSNGQEMPDEKSSESYLLEHPLVFFKKIDYWGWILLISAIPIFCITKALYGSEAPVEPVKIPQQVVRVEAPEVVPVEFPPLKLDGFVYNGMKSTAVIDGATIKVGGTVKGVKLVAIEPRGVVVEMGGIQKLLTQEVSNQLPRQKGS